MTTATTYEVITRPVNASNVPVKLLETVRRHAAAAGYGDSDSATLRFALNFAATKLASSPIQGRDPGDETTEKE